VISINIISFFLNFTLLIISFKNNKFIYFIYLLIFLFLVTLQSLFITYDILINDTVFYLYNKIDYKGHLFASLFILYYLLVTSFLEFFKNKKKKLNLIFIEKKVIKFSFFYIIINWAFLFSIIYLIIKLVGLNSIIEDSRPGASGNTFLLLLLSLCNYPLYFKISKNADISINEILLFIITIFFTFFFSRLIASFHILLVTIIYLEIKFKTPIKKLKTYKFKILMLFGLFFLIFISIGIIRDLQNFSKLNDNNSTNIFNYLNTNSELVLDVIFRIYKVGVEGISGLSGILTSFFSNYELHADFGISATAGFFNLIPSFFRDILGSIPGNLMSFYWYNGSVVGSGIEAIFVHFSFFGLIIFPFLIHFYISNNIIKIDNSIIKYNSNNFNTIKYCTLLVYGLLLIRGSSFAFIFFVSSNIIIFKIADLIYKLSHEFKIIKT
jgi:hypothetical protein